MRLPVILDFISKSEICWSIFLPWERSFPIISYPATPPLTLCFSLAKTTHEWKVLFPICVSNPTKLLHFNNSNIHWFSGNPSGYSVNLIIHFWAWNPQADLSIWLFYLKRMSERDFTVTDAARLPISSVRSHLYERRPSSYSHKVTCRISCCRGWIKKNRNTGGGKKSSARCFQKV